MMEDKRPDKKRGGCAGLHVVGLLLLLPVLYVASLGPACWMEINGFISNEVLRAVYAPIVWVMNHSEPIGRVLNWYCEWWMP